MKATSHWHDVIRNLCVCPPAKRMVLISAWATEKQEGHIIYPVVAIERFTLETYSYYMDKPPSPHMTYTELIDNGYSYVDSVELTSELFVYDGSVRSTFKPMGFNIRPYEVVVCDWTESEDEVRLSAKVAELKKLIKADSAKMKKPKRKLVSK